MTASIDKLIHKVNSSTANLTCILTNGIAYHNHTHSHWNVPVNKIPPYAGAEHSKISSHGNGLYAIL